MITKSSLFLPLAATALPMLSSAQSLSTDGPAESATVRNPKFYIGLAAATGSSASPDGFSGAPTTPTTRNHVPVLPKLTVGWQLQPRLALQISGQYAQQNDTYNFVQGLTDPNGQPSLFPGSRSFRLHSLAVPVLARYTLTNNLTHRFQADLLGGVTLVHRFVQYNSYVYIPAPDNTQPPITSIAYDKSSTATHLSIGPSLRYRVGSRLEVTGDVVANYRVNGDPSTMGGYTFNDASTRTSLASSLGLRYSLGAH